jgi:hypothetical protein
MADNLKIKDGDRITTYVRTTYDEATGVHTPHYIVETAEGVPLEVSIAGSTASGGNLGVQVNNTDPIPVTLGGLSNVGGALPVTSSWENPIAAVVSPKIPKQIIKKRFSNINAPAGYINNIDWDNSAKGAFRICEYNPERKYVTIYNDSTSDLFISVANDANPKIVIESDSLDSFKDLRFKYIYKTIAPPGTEISEKILFNYNLSQLVDPYTRFSFIEETGKFYGQNVSSNIQKISSGYLLTIYLTSDYFPYILNKYNIDTEPGVLNITLDGTTSNININIPSNSYQSYVINGKITQSVLSNGIINLYSVNGNKNGLNLDLIQPGDEYVKAPEDYSYIIYSKEAYSVGDQDSIMPIFGYLIKPQHPAVLPAVEELVIRITEAV